MNLKKSYRRELLALRRELSSETRAFCSAAIREHLLKFMASRLDGRLLAYASIHGEPDLLPLAARLPTGKFLLPFSHIMERRLSFHTWIPEEELVINQYGIAEPHPVGDGLMHVNDIIAVPAVALSANGYRLGYGGGYYDRFLEGYDGIVVGVVYSGFLLEKLPVESHDLRVGWIVTERGIVKVSE